jgi:hypothetical protein
MQLTQTQISEMTTRDPSVVDTIIIHHAVADPTLDISQIAAMEEAAQDFITVGYHEYLKLVDPANDQWVAQMGRLINEVPAAALDYNTKSYDICVGGNYEPNVEGVPTNQVSPNALKLVIARVQAVKAKLPNLKYLIGHRDVANVITHNPNDATACPGDLLYAQLWQLRQATGLHSYGE